MEGIISIQEKQLEKELLSKRFIALREKLDVSQREIAAIFGVPLRTWQNWEYASRKPDASAIALLSHYENHLPTVKSPTDLCKELRARLALRKMDMAKIFNCTLNTWGDWERGVRKPHPKALEQIEKMLSEIQNDSSISQMLKAS